MAASSLVRDSHWLAGKGISLSCVCRGGVCRGGGAGSYGIGVGGDVSSDALEAARRVSVMRNPVHQPASYVSSCHSLLLQFGPTPHLIITY